MNKSFKPLRNRAKNSFDKRNHLALVRKKTDYEGTVVEFQNADGSIRVLTINNQFTQKQDGNPMRVSQIIEKLNTLKHDFNAIKYKIN